MSNAARHADASQTADDLSPDAVCLMHETLGILNWLPRAASRKLMKN
jgi:hypothetical protein